MPTVDNVYRDQAIGIMGVHCPLSSAKIPSSDVRARKIEFVSSVQNWECLFGSHDLDIHCGHLI